MAPGFGPRRRITYKQLLYNLEHRCKCLVVEENLGGIPDTGDTTSGRIYRVERRPSDPDTPFAFIEVYHENLVVLDDALESYCAQLELDEDFVCGGSPH